MTKKIMFNDKFCLTKAVLDGTKTMTRRSFARFEPDARMFDEIYNIEGGFNDKGRWIFTLYNKDGDVIGDMIPHYNIGEVVAIAQSYNDIYNELEAQGNWVSNEWWCNALDIIGKGLDTLAGYKNKMFTRADFMIHHAKITDVKVERLQDITAEDALKEGICKFVDSYYLPNGYGKSYNRPREAFACLINKVSGKGTWESNPWVAVYSFELVD